MKLINKNPSSKLLSKAFSPSKLRSKVFFSAQKLEKSFGFLCLKRGYRSSAFRLDSQAFEAKLLREKMVSLFSRLVASLGWRLMAVT